MRFKLLSRIHTILTEAGLNVQQFEKMWERGYERKLLRREPTGTGYRPTSDFVATGCGLEVDALQHWLLNNWGRR
jgi:hypothetical protein